MRCTTTVLLCVLATGCATTRVVPPSAPQVDVTTREVPPLPSRAILIVGRDTFRSVAANLVIERAVADVPPAGDDAAALAPLERVMFEAGWEPLPQPTVTRIVTGHRTAVALRDLLARGGATLLEVGTLVAPASTADVLLVV